MNAPAHDKALRHQPQLDMFSTEVAGATTIEKVAQAQIEIAPEAAPSIEPRLSRRQAAVKAVRHDQLDLLFSYDVMGAVAIMEAAEAAQAQVEIALGANPSILPAAADQPDARDNLDFARFMRAVGVPTQEVQESLQQVGADAGEVLAQLAQVEAEVGSDYPTEEVDDRAPDESDGVAAESGVTEESGEREGHDPVASTARQAKDELSDSALAALMKRIRSPRCEPLTAEQETALAARIKAGDVAACSELADRNMRFLVLMAKRFRYTGRPLDELISAGTIGLLAAVKKFDPARGRFTTCAQHWIRQSIQRSLCTDSLMKTPAYMPAKESRLRKDAECAVNPQERATLLAKADGLKREIAARRATHVSLDAGPDDDSDTGNLYNRFAEDSASIEDQLEQARLVEWLNRAANHELKTMEGKPDTRARDVFLLRLGLHHEHYGDPLTLADIAALVKVSRERVRQIYNEAAFEVVEAVEHYAKGPENLPTGFREGILNRGHRGAAAEPREPGEVAMEAIFAAEAAGPEECQKRAQMVTWLVKAANRELKTEDGKSDALSRDIFLMRVGLHPTHYGEPQSIAQIGRHLTIARTQVCSLYDAAAAEVAFAIEHYAQGADNLPKGFRRSLMSPPR